MPEPPHPEERGCRSGSANSNKRARVSKDGAAVRPSCFETPRHSARKTRVNALKARLLSMREQGLVLRCARDTRAPRILAKRTQGSFWPNEAKAHFGHLSSPRKRGPMITAGGYGSRLSPRFREGRPGRRSLGPRDAPTCGCAKTEPGQFRCFGVVIYNDFCNSHVLGRRGRCATPYVTPMCHHPS